MSVFPQTLHPDQQKLIDTIWAGYQQAGEWPIFEYVEAMLDKEGLDVVQVMAGLPAVGHGGLGGPSYGLVRPPVSQGRAPGRSEKLALTVAGLNYVTAASGLVGTFLRILDLMVETRREAVFDPVKQTDVVVSSEMMHRHLQPIDLEDLGYQEQITLTEPPTWFQATVPPGSTWARDARREIRHFAGVGDVEDYLGRVAVYLAVPEPPAVARYASPFELAASLDYFNAIWKLHVDKKRPILRFYSAERAGKLGLDAGTEEEFHTRLTALGEVLKNMDVPSTPGVGGHALERLPVFLKTKVPTANADRIDHAVAVLYAIKVLRDSGQHVEALAESAGKLPVLGLTFPIIDWSGAWNTISTAAIEAFDTLRDELNVLGEDAEA